ncbi:hypothetical protein HN51_068661 [Arachis hypogaea]|uniref:Salicylate carboxymethyltransferase n=1 Tax=Arachis hypogaea TaxID=3818 RepID=A0A444Z9G0_ARAHY|nr:salicylate carboxymethyltransferase [Arachis ipaensis]XP_025650785.1 salicylate carboxymethyltransferase [Arachis hypogaea]QHO10760.1 Salicylate carboxymethyltransferase [Arachis hypogaea]RYR10810.1 hypothetical protein Ahy_B05g079294 [Arachis hypogaea]
MKIDQVLHMNEGMGEASYARNSLLQQKAISIAKPMIEEAITTLYCNTLPRNLAIADLGCSSGPNTFFVVTQIIKFVETLSQQLNRPSPEYQVLLNDLPANDFNSIFKSIPTFKHELYNEIQANKIGHCFISGVPGSFYGRLFPTRSLHFVHSSYSLHWLSQVPEGIEKNNKGNIYITRTSPKKVLKAYYEQFERDISWFLRSRAEELVEGGCMVLTILGRRSEDPSSKESAVHIYELFANALNHLVFKGLIQADQLHSFNIPNYIPSSSELKLQILKQGSFKINRTEVSSVHWTHCGSDNEHKSGAYNVAKCMRAVLEPLVLQHFGEAIIDEAFRVFQELLADTMSKEKTEFFNITLYLTKQSRSYVCFN